MAQAHHMTAPDWDLVVDVNLKGVLHVIRAVYPRMVEQGFGHLVNTASIAGLIAPPFLAAYVATKHAVVGLSKSMRVEAKRFGVRVSVLCPGAVKTPLLTGGVFGRSVYDMSDEAVIVLPKFDRTLLRMLRLVPGLEERIEDKLLARALATFPEMERPSSR